MRLIILSLLLVSVKSIAQEKSEVFWEGELAINYAISTNLTFNTSVGQRTVFTKNGDTNSSLIFMQINHFASYKLRPNVIVSAGYMFRKPKPFENSSQYEHRSTQLISINHINEAIRLSSRLRVEQRFREDEFEHRYRYRLAADFPLSGQTLDTNEFYVAFGNEVLLSIIEKETILDNRINSALGYTFNHFKVQLGLTYRIENIGQTNNLWFVSTGLYFDLD